ncbi:MAG: hypothetical protein AB2689_21660, partial [Candidatus Thiodiazotropha taylori]
MRAYRPKQAHRLSVERRLSKSQPRIATTHCEQAEHLLRENWSPEQISLWLCDEVGIQIPHEGIY